MNNTEGYTTKIERARQILATHLTAANQQPTEGFATAADLVNHLVDGFVDQLRALGGTTEEALAQCSWEDLAKCGAPPLIAKQLASVFRAVVQTPGQQPVITERVAERMTTGQLLTHYDASEPNAIHDRLQRESKGHPFIVFLDARRIHIPVTAQLLKELRDGFPPRQQYVDPDTQAVRRVYRIGERPDNLVDENPIYIGRPLRPDGTCDQLNRSWDGVPLSVRQLVRCIMQEDGRIDVQTAHTLLDMALESDAPKRLQMRYPKAALRFSELEVAEDLPKLRVPITGRAGVENPFSGRNRTH